MSDQSEHGLPAPDVARPCGEQQHNSLGKQNEQDGRAAVDAIDGSGGHAKTGDSRGGGSSSDRSATQRHDCHEGTGGDGHEPSRGTQPMTMQEPVGTFPEVRADSEKEDDQPPFKQLTKEEAQALMAQHPPVSPWRVVAVQAVVGVGVALLAGWLAGRMEVLWSALYGAAIVVVPGALMAHGMTRRLPGVTAGGLAVGFMAWEFAKIGLSVVMLLLANRIVQPLSWLALLAGLVVCAKVYWLALWRRR